MVPGDVAFGVDWGVTGTVSPPHHGEKRTETDWGNTQSVYPAQSHKATRVSTVSVVARCAQLLTALVL